MMNVLGAEINDYALELAFSQAVEVGLSFCALQGVILKMMPHLTLEQSYRAADRLLQKKRRAGVCEYRKGKWVILSDVERG